MRTIVLFLLLAGPAFAAPPDAVAMALADARACDKETAYHTRYLDLSNHDQKTRAFYTRLLTFQFNLLSRETAMVPPRPVAGGMVLAVDLRDYGINTQVWERLIAREPAYHQTREIIEQVPVHGRDAYNRPVVTSYTQKSVRKTVPADHLPKAMVDELYALTQSAVPVVWGDWWFAQTSIEADRGGIGTGYGYYDFLGMKNRADYFKLIGFDEKEWRSVVSEVAAVIMGHNSGVAMNDRMAVRRAAVDGFAWFTLDFFDNNRDERNPLAFLDRDKGLKHQAERHFGRLPNGLPVVIACDDKGVLQETAPDKIGPDKTANGSDTRIHSAKSCFSCHSNGFLKDINDEVRSIYVVDRQKGYNLLTSPVKEETLKLSRIYLRDFQRYIDDDRRAYARAVKDCTGQEPADASADYRDGYEQYVLKPVTPDMIAAACGVTPDVLKRQLVLYRTADKLTIHTLAPLSVGRPISRTNFESLYPLLMGITRGVQK